MALLPWRLSSGAPKNMARCLTVDLFLPVPHCEAPARFILACLCFSSEHPAKAAPNTLRLVHVLRTNVAGGLCSTYRCPKVAVADDVV